MRQAMTNLKPMQYVISSNCEAPDCVNTGKAPAILRFRDSAYYELIGPDADIFVVGGELDVIDGFKEVYLKTLYGDVLAPVRYPNENKFFSYLKSKFENIKLFKDQRSAWEYYQQLRNEIISRYYNED